MKQKEENQTVGRIQPSFAVIAYSRLSFRALGFFLLHIVDRCYGFRDSEATMMACSYDEVKRRIANRGNHIATFATNNAEDIVTTFCRVYFTDDLSNNYFGLARVDFIKLLDKERNGILWAPDGDEAFDDGSYVLQFDQKEKVRLIAFQRRDSCLYDPMTFSDICLPADDFYEILQRWSSSFETEWANFYKEGS